MATGVLARPRRARDGTASPPRPGWSLYAQVVVVNSLVWGTAVLLLVLTPITVSNPVAPRQGLVIAAGLVLVVLADAILVRRSFTGLSALVRRMETIDVLQPEVRLPEAGGGETRVLMSGFNAMLERLETERRASTKRAVWALESERRRIGQELHDEIGQRLTGTLLQLGRLHDEAPQPLRARIAAVQDEQRATLDEVGALAWQLRPGILDDLGLVSAVDALVESFQEHAPAELTARLPRHRTALPSDVELVVYRVAQEALTNAVRHSGASHVDLTLEVHRGAVTLHVTDDGIGLWGGDADGSGIRGMRERALLVQGRLVVTSRPGSGVTVQLDVPTAPGQE